MDINLTDIITQKENNISKERDNLKAMLIRYGSDVTLTGNKRDSAYRRLLYKEVAYIATTRMKISNLKGKSGWWDINYCSKITLKSALLASVKRNDWIAVINYAGMLFAKDIINNLK